MLHVMNLRLSEDIGTDLVRGQGSIFRVHIQSNYPKYTILLIPNAELSEFGPILTSKQTKAL